MSFGCACRGLPDGQDQFVLGYMSQAQEVDQFFPHELWGTLVLCLLSHHRLLFFIMSQIYHHIHDVQGS